MQVRTGVCITAMVLAGTMSSTAAVADEMFLKLTGLAPNDFIGDSTDEQHPNEIVLLSYSVGAEADSSWTKGGGASVGKANPLDLRFTTAMNRSVPAIVKYIATGKAVPTAVLTIRSDVAGPRPGFEYAKYTFEGLFFTGVGQGLTGAGRAVNAVSAVYKTVKVQQFAPGNPTAVSCVLWDIPAGTAGDC